MQLGLAPSCSSYFVYLTFATFEIRFNLALFSNQFKPRSLKAEKLRLWAVITSEEPVAQLLRSTARKEWRLIALNLISSIVEAFSEGATLGIIFLAVDVLTVSSTASYNWATKPLMSHIPPLVAWFNSLPAVAIFVSLLVVALFLQALQSFARYLNLVSLGYFTARCKKFMAARIHGQVLSLSFPCASGYRVGDLTDYVAQAPLALRVQIEQSSQLIVASLLIITYLAVLMRISTWLLVVVALIAIVMIVLQKRLIPLIRKGSMQVAQAEAAINSLITEDFQALRLLHSMGQLDASKERVQSKLSMEENLCRSQSRRMAVIGPFLTFLPVLAISIIAILSLVFLGGRSNGVLPGLVTFVVALQRLNQRLSGAANNLNKLADNQGRIHRLNQILTPNCKQFRRLAGIPFHSFAKGIRFDCVSLRYSPEMSPAVREISFELSKGSLMALVGSSGSGKSSVVDLICGLYVPSSGQILIDGRPLEDLDLASWQRKLGVVSQDTFLFNSTIYDNIVFGMPNVDQARVSVACEAAQAAEFIERLPDGYNTVVGERGYRLSGGQRQRLSLARALVRNPELLILDEATSALDSESERLVQEAINGLDNECTVLAVAHRLATIAKADQILVLESGAVVGSGDHRGLMESCDLYGAMWALQSRPSS